MPRRRRRLSPRRRWVVLVAVTLVVLGGGGALAWRLTHPGTAATGATTRTVAVSRETLKQTVGTTGTVQPARRADLSFAAAGTVTSVKVAVGDKVSTGDVLATLDDDDLQADVDAAEADLKAAEDDLTTAEDDSDTTSTELSAAKAKVAVKKSAVTQAKSARDGAKLRATFSGTVAAVGVARGDAVGSGSSGSGSTSGTSSSTTTAAVTVISTNRYTVAASVGSADLAKVKKGLQAQIVPTGSSSTVFGTVSSVAVMASASSGSSSGSSATFPVTIEVTGTPKSLYAGASATVTIIVAQRTGVLTVPTAAVTTAGGTTVVTKVVSGRPVPTEVTLGQSYGATTEVTKGLAEGDLVEVSTTARAPSGTSSERQRQGGYAGQGGGFPGAGTGGGVPGTGNR